ncbi:PREDICTED: synaptogyrin-2 [Myotis brandtii]|uniref:synaptogyrin-2 n=1 Tax=Myotis brandtii TaxID=109478 RepID=UPI0003BBE42F|nr:PREDICTED: synaptogyrin-2 [Myotis brandtii]
MKAARQEATGSPAHPHVQRGLDADPPPPCPQVFALIVFSCIFGEGYSNTHESNQRYCVFNHNEDACRYGSAIGVLAFLACAFFFVVDVYFPQISNAVDRKYLVIGDLLFSGICPGVAPPLLPGGGWMGAAGCGLLAALAYQRYKAGVDDFMQNYADPTPDPSTAYASYPGPPVDSYQQPPFTQNAEATEGYQPPVVY